MDSPAPAHVSIDDADLQLDFCGFYPEYLALCHHAAGLCCPAELSRGRHSRRLCCKVFASFRAVSLLSPYASHCSLPSPLCLSVSLPPSLIYVPLCAYSPCFLLDTNLVVFYLLQRWLLKPLQTRSSLSFSRASTARLHAWPTIPPTTRKAFSPPDSSRCRATRTSLPSRPSGYPSRSLPCAPPTHPAGRHWLGQCP